VVASSRIRARDSSTACPCAAAQARFTQNDIELPSFARPDGRGVRPYVVRRGGSLGSSEGRKTRATAWANPRTMLSVERTPRRSVGGACLAVPLLYGLVPAIVGCVVLHERAAESALLVAFGALSFIGGALMVSSAAWLLITVGRSSLALWTGGISSILSAALFAGVTLTDVLPCSGPD
jgi:hypothetical protein